MKELSIFVSRDAKKKAIIALVVIGLVFVALAILSVIYFREIEYWKVILLASGSFLPVSLILLNIMQIVLPVIPGQITGILFGFFYGPILGTTISFLSLMLGSILVFFISRKFGRPFVEKIIKKKDLDKFYYLADHKGTFLFFFLFLLPMVPDDIICYLIGLTNMSFKKYFLILFFGRLPSVIFLGLTGYNLSVSGFWNILIIILISACLLILLFVFRKELHLFLKYIKDKINL